MTGELPVPRRGFCVLTGPNSAYTSSSPRPTTTLEALHNPFVCDQFCCFRGSVRVGRPRVRSTARDPLSLRDSVDTLLIEHRQSTCLGEVRRSSPRAAHDGLAAALPKHELRSGGRADAPATAGALTAALGSSSAT
mmetsp:Transcript_65362/g.179362  ORF Transcript_65362/g.179362 Transcript_65362/m.179362 type:complete len:136 (+) Transcript_65362:116-523(+)